MYSDVVDVFVPVNVGSEVFVVLEDDDQLSLADTPETCRPLPFWCRNVWSQTWVTTCRRDSTKASRALRCITWPSRATFRHWGRSWHKTFRVCVPPLPTVLLGYIEMSLIWMKVCFCNKPLVATLDWHDKTCSIFTVRLALYAEFIFPFYPYFPIGFEKVLRDGFGQFIVFHAQFIYTIAPHISLASIADMLEDVTENILFCLTFITFVLPGWALRSPGFLTEVSDDERVCSSMTVSSAAAYRGCQRFAVVGNRIQIPILIDSHGVRCRPLDEIRSKGAL